MAREISNTFIRMLQSEFRPIVDYVKNHPDVFLGIRKNRINLYVHNGSLFQLEEYKNEYYPYVNPKYLAPDYDDEAELRRFLDQHNNCNGEGKANHSKPMKEGSIWIEMLPKLHAVVKSYQEGKHGPKTVHREEIVQQKLYHAINQEHNNMFALDLEYNIEGISDYQKDDDDNSLEKKQTPGRIDMVVLSLLDQRRLKVYYMEVKVGSSSLGGVSADSYGAGIAGHLHRFLPLIHRIEHDFLYSKTCKIRPREVLLTDIRHLLNAYLQLGFLHRKPQYETLDFESMEIEKVELVLYLAGYDSTRKHGSFENHLGIGGGESKRSVWAILHQTYKNGIKFMEDEELTDFKYITTKANIESTSFNIDFDHFETIKRMDLLASKQ